VEDSGKTAGYTVPVKGKQGLLEEKVRILREMKKDYSERLKSGALGRANPEMIKVEISLKQTEAELERMKLRYSTGTNSMPADLFILKTIKEQELKELAAQYSSKNATLVSVDAVKLELLDTEIEMSKYSGLPNYQNFCDAAKSWANSPDDPDLLTAMISAEKTLVKRTAVKKNDKTSDKNAEKKTVKVKEKKEKKDKKEKK